MKIIFFILLLPSFVMAQDKKVTNRDNKVDNQFNNSTLYIYNPKQPDKGSSKTWITGEVHENGQPVQIQIKGSLFGSPANYETTTYKGFLRWEVPTTSLINIKSVRVIISHSEYVSYDKEIGLLNNGELAEKISLEKIKTYRLCHTLYKNGTTPSFLYANFTVNGKQHSTTSNILNLSSEICIDDMPTNPKNSVEVSFVPNNTELFKGFEYLFLTTEQKYFLKIPDSLGISLNTSNEKTLIWFYAQLSNLENDISLSIDSSKDFRQTYYDYILLTELLMQKIAEESSKERFKGYQGIASQFDNDAIRTRVFERKVKCRKYIEQRILSQFAKYNSIATNHNRDYIVLCHLITRDGEVHNLLKEIYNNYTYLQEICDKNVSNYPEYVSIVTQCDRIQDALNRCLK